MQITKAYLIFQVICLITTGSLVVRCIRKYARDEDTTQVEYRKFHDGKESLYPSIAICFSTSSLFDQNVVEQAVLSKPKLFKYWKCLRKWSYGRCRYVLIGLLGNLFEITDYDKVTKDLMSHLLNIKMSLQNDGKLIWSKSNGSLKLSLAYKTDMNNASIIHQNFTKEKIDTIPIPKIYPSYKSYFKKCYSLDLPFIEDVQIKKLELSFKGSIFRYGIRPHKNEFRVWFHYPNQQLMSMSAQNTWISKYRTSTHYQRDIYLGYINILQRRNKRRYPCHTQNHDQQVIKRATKLLECKYHDFDTANATRFCQKWSQVKAFKYELSKNIKNPPCRSLVSAYDWYKEDDLSKGYKGEPKINLIFHYPDHFYKEIIYNKEYSFESLVGNIGGYIGNVNFL